MEIEALNQTNPVSINVFVNKFLASQRPLQMLINKAAVMWISLLRDERGNKEQFSGNHLGHF